MSTPQIAIRTEPRPNCFLCSSPGERLYENLPSALFETAGSWNFSQCSNRGCGLIWINPCPVDEDLHIAYEQYFTHGEAKPTGRGFRDLLFLVYQAANLPIWIPTGVTREKSRRKRMFLEQDRPGKLLDVGCGDGTFLNLMQTEGWEVDGIDFDPKAIRAAKTRYRLALRHGDLRAAGLLPDQFDAVTMSHVVEHLADPISLLVEIRRILKPGGKLIMTTPNTDSLGHKEFGPHWFGIDAPRHLNLFNKVSLCAAAKQAGLSLNRAGSTSANADIFIGASYTIQENHRHRMGHEPTPNLMRTIKAACWQLKEHKRLSREPECGEELVLICQK